MIRAEMKVHSDYVDALDVGGRRDRFVGARRTTLTLEVELPTLSSEAMAAVHRTVVMMDTAALSDANCLRQIADAIDGGEGAGSNAKPAEDPRLGAVTTGSKTRVKRALNLD